MEGSYIYVIGADHGRVKIGVTERRPIDRLAELQTGSPFRLHFVFVGQVAGPGFDVENEVLYILNPHRQEGDWFAVPNDVAITAVMAASHRLGYRIVPVDGDSAPRGVTKTPEQWPAWAMVLGFGIPAGSAFAVLMKTDHFLTAMIVGVFAALICRLVMKRLLYFNATRG